jgi:hypothetical protein
MNVDVNWLAVVLAALSSMVVGSIWYAKPVFGASWMKMVGLDDKKAAEGAAVAMGLTLVVSFVTAYVLAHVAFLSNEFFGNSFLQDSLTTAFWVWLGFTASRFLTHDLFEHRRKKLTLMNIGNEFVTIMVMGLVIGLLGVN